jgi:hypothetical protein
MQEKKIRKKWMLALLWAVIALLVLVAATYAWFTFAPYTNVEPISSTVSQGDISLLISNQQNEDFDVSCVLTPDSKPDELYPISTADLQNFASAIGQNQEGISVLYQDVTKQFEDYAIHGTVYLKSKNGSCDVYLYRTGMNVGTDAQAMAALRLGMKLTTESGTETYIFRLDDMGNTGSASSTRTVPYANTVVSSVADSGTATYITDPSEGMADYFAEENDTSKPDAGVIRLGVLQKDEIASVEYWLYLEGCDDNCINAVWSRDIALQLAFAGVKRDS